MANNPSTLLIGTASSELNACRKVLRDGNFGGIKSVSPARFLKSPQSYILSHDAIVVICKDVDVAASYVHNFRSLVGHHPLLAIDCTGDPDFVARVLEAGADDLIPFRRVQGQLAARIKALYRRYNFLDERVDRVLLVAGDIKIDFRLHRVWVHGQEVSLSPTEFRILRKLCMHVGRVVSHQDLLVEAWGEQRPEMADSLRVYIRYIRRKIQATSQLVRIVSRPGIGYMLAVPS